MKIWHKIPLSEIIPSANTKLHSESFWKQRIENKVFSKEHREILRKALFSQYEKIEFSDEVRINIQKLLEENSRTITTGQQIVTALGPWMVLYKIATAIKLSQSLSKRFSSFQFVPVFWMATEDHDWMEIADIRKGNAQIKWSHHEGGAVGRLLCDTTLRALNDWNESFPQYAFHQDILDAYGKYPDLSLATRYLVNKVFGHLGLVVIDSDDPNLKKLVEPLLQSELREQKLFHLAQKHNVVQGEIEIKNYNLFHLAQGSRSRIADAAQAHSLLEQNDLYSWSPNVAMRIFYQETILPNIAYVGGPSEQKYWSQVSPFFQDLNISEPAFILRERGVMIPEKWVNKWDSLNWDKNLCLNPKECFSADLAAKYGDQEVLGDLRLSIERAFESHYEKIQLEDPTLLNAAKGDCVKSLQMVEQLEKKIQRARKRKEEDTLQFVERWTLQVKPKDHLAERWDHWIFDWQKNKHIVDVLIDQIDFEDPTFKVWSF